MSSPAYDGKGQPPVDQGWLSGLASWWTGLSPQYVTHASSGLSGTPHRGASSTVITIAPPGVPAGTPGASADSSSAQPPASGTTPSTTPGAAKQ